MPKNIARVLFVDFHSAFDSVVWRKLFRILEEKRILNSGEIELLKFIYSNVRISNGKGLAVPIEKGTPQGMTTSPLLF